MSECFFLYFKWWLFPCGTVTEHKETCSHQLFPLLSSGAESASAIVQICYLICLGSVNGLIEDRERIPMTVLCKFKCKERPTNCAGDSGDKPITFTRNECFFSWLLLLLANQNNHMIGRFKWIQMKVDILCFEWSKDEKVGFRLKLEGRELQPTKQKDKRP